jgi:tripartite-type tricarboxylate transporter receptor subunit TctC
MPYRGNSKYDRRKFLKATGAAAGVGLLAGCSGDGGDGSGGDGGDGGDGGSGGDGGDGGSGGDGGDGGSGPAYPEQDIRFIIPFGPGGGYDFYGRLISKYLPQHLPNDVNVQAQNVEGAGGQVATEQVWAEEGNPYVHWIVNMVNFGLTQLTEDDLDWDLREFTYYAQVAEEFRGVAVGTNTDIETWDDFVEAVNNEELNFASTGPGSGYVTVPGVIGDIGGLYPASNVMDNQVIYDGRGEAIQGILAGDAQVMSGSYFSILPYVESGDVRMVMTCTTEDEPPEMTPDSATLSSAGVENAQAIVDMLATRRIYAGPPGIDEEVAQINIDAYMEALTENDDLLSEAEEADRPIVPLEGPEAQEAVSGFIDNWSERQELLATLYGQ